MFMPLSPGGREYPCERRSAIIRELDVGCVGLERALGEPRRAGARLDGDDGDDYDELDGNVEGA